MTDDTESLGCCPDCGHRIPTKLVLVKYETDDGGTGIWAKCPGCGEVVDPE